MTYSGSSYAGAAYASGSAAADEVESVGTDMSNALEQRRREGVASVIDMTPVVPLPEDRARGVETSIAFTYPTPTLDNGRPV